MRPDIPILGGGGGFEFTGGLAADRAAMTVTPTEKPAVAFQRQYNLISPEGAELIPAYGERRKSSVKHLKMLRESSDI